MRWALLADVHANLEALRAVLAEVDSFGELGLICAGDLVGYGPDPGACLDLLRERGAICIRGNHDGMLLGELPLNRCPHAAIQAVLWQRPRVDAEQRRWLSSLPVRVELPPDLVVCHGNLDDPCHYLATPGAAQAALADLARRYPQRTVLVCGHTHHAVLFRAGAWRPPQGPQWQSTRGARVLINPGSVGQARDGVPVARYAIYDADAGAVSFRTIAYDHFKTQSKIQAAGLKARVVMPKRIREDSHLDRLRLRWLLWQEKRKRSAS